MHPHTLITYDDALPLFRAANICNCTRTIHRHVKANPKRCPVFRNPDPRSDVVLYHYRRVRLGDVQSLITRLVKEGRGRKSRATLRHYKSEL